jgi:hypothetical protein
MPATSALIVSANPDVPLCVITSRRAISTLWICSLQECFWYVDLEGLEKRAELAVELAPDVRDFRDAEASELRAGLVGAEPRFAGRIFPDHACAGLWDGRSSRWAVSRQGTSSRL